MEFDYVVGNPPYLGKQKLYIHIFQKMLSLGKEIIFIHPCMPFFNKNSTSSVVHTFNTTLSQRCTEIQIADISDFSEAAITNELCITKTRKTNESPSVCIKYPGQSPTETEIQNINKLQIPPEQWERVVEFFESIPGRKLSDVLERNDSGLPKDRVFFQLSIVRGNVNRTEGGIKDDFFTFFSKQKYNQCNQIPQDKIKYGFEIEYENIPKAAKYLETKFARFALALRKFDYNATKGYFKYVPLVDFNNTLSYYTDAQMFKDFKVPKDIQQNILDLPDYSVM